MMFLIKNTDHEDTNENDKHNDNGDDKSKVIMTRMMITI